MHKRVQSLVDNLSLSRSCAFWERSYFGFLFSVFIFVVIIKKTGARLRACVIYTLQKEQRQTYTEPKGKFEKMIFLRFVVSRCRRRRRRSFFIFTVPAFIRQHTLSHIHSTWCTHILSFWPSVSSWCGESEREKRKKSISFLLRTLNLVKREPIPTPIQFESLHESPWVCRRRVRLESVRTKHTLALSQSSSRCVRQRIGNSNGAHSVAISRRCFAIK